MCPNAHRKLSKVLFMRTFNCLQYRKFCGLLSLTRTQNTYMRTRTHKLPLSRTQTGMAPIGPAKSSGHIRRGDQLVAGLSSLLFSSLYLLSYHCAYPIVCQTISQIGITCIMPLRLTDCSMLCTSPCLHTVDGTEITGWDVKEIVDLIIGAQVSVSQCFLFDVSVSSVQYLCCFSLVLPVECLWLVRGLN